MTYEKTFFLSVLSDYLAKRKTDSSPDVNWDDVVRWAKTHQLEGILYFQCRDSLPEEILGILDKGISVNLFYYKNREKVLQSINDIFKEIQIPFVTIKGMEVSKCYPVPFLRTMSDIDILVHREDKERAAAALSNLGFSIGEKNPDYDWPCNYNGMSFELHHNLFYNEITTIEKQALFFNDYWAYVADGRLDWNFHYLYLIAHLRKHIMYSGAGFRMFMDLAAVAQNIDKLNWCWIEKKLIELDLLKFAQVCFSLIECWFGFDTPIKHPRLNQEFVDKVTDKIFENGVFGFDNKENKDNGSINQLIKNGEVNWKSRLEVLINTLFPSYNNMSNSPYYHFVRGKKWLLPVAWVYRIYRLMIGKTSRVNEINQRIMTSKERIDERKSELRDWGLLEE